MSANEWPAEVQAELEDERFLTRKHYSRATYALGCHGPLCRKAETDRGRKRNQQRAEEDGREYRPIRNPLSARAEREMDAIVQEYLSSRNPPKRHRLQSSAVPATSDVE